jgi:hypothetical protein
VPLETVDGFGFAPIGLDEPYRFIVGNNSVNFVDPLGLITVCYYADAAGSFGHVGFGDNPNDTSGFYPTGNPFNSPGIIKKDTQQMKQCKDIDSSKDQDNCMKQCQNARAATPGNYRLRSRQCTSYVRDCLTQCGLPSGDYNGPRPWPLYDSLPGQSKPLAGKSPF